MPIIVLSRQVGSYGSEIAQRVAESMGYQLIDRDEIRTLAERCDPDFKDACALYEREIPKDMWERYFFDKPTYQSLFESLSFELAARGQVVLMGRGVQVALTGHRGVLKVRVVASFDTRVDRIVEKKGLPLKEAKEFVRSFGHQRRALVEGIYHRNLSDWSLYDLIINTEDMSPDQGAKIVVSAAEAIRPVIDREEQKAWFLRMAFAKRVESTIRKKAKAKSLGRISVASPAMGHLILTGTVGNNPRKILAESVAREFPEVTKVENLIKVIGLSGV